MIWKQEFGKLERGGRLLLVCDIEDKLGCSLHQRLLILAFDNEESSESYRPSALKTVTKKRMRRSEYEGLRIRPVNLEQAAQGKLFIPPSLFDCLEMVGMMASRKRATLPGTWRHFSIFTLRLRRQRTGD